MISSTHWTSRTSRTRNASRSTISAAASSRSRRRYGFLDEPNLLRALAQCRLQELRFGILLDTSFIIGREKLVPSRRRSTMWPWRKRLFILMSNNALDATEFFCIPPNRVVELGGQVEI